MLAYHFSFNSGIFICRARSASSALECQRSADGRETIQQCECSTRLSDTHFVWRRRRSEHRWPNQTSWYTRRMYSMSSQVWSIVFLDMVRMLYRNLAGLDNLLIRVWPKINNGRWRAMYNKCHFKLQYQMFSPCCLLSCIYAGNLA